MANSGRSAKGKEIIPKVIMQSIDSEKKQANSGSPIKCNSEKKQANSGNSAKCEEIISEKKQAASGNSTKCNSEKKQANSGSSTKCNSEKKQANSGSSTKCKEINSGVKNNQDHSITKKQNTIETNNQIREKTLKVK